MIHLLKQFFDIYDLKKTFNINEFQHVITLKNGSTSFLINYLTSHNSTIFNHQKQKLLEKNQYTIEKYSPLTNQAIKFVLYNHIKDKTQQKNFCNICYGKKYYFKTKDNIEKIINRKLVQSKQKCHICDGSTRMKCKLCYGHNYRLCSMCNNTGVSYDYSYGRNYSCGCNNQSVYHTNGFCKNYHCYNGYETCDNCHDGYLGEDVYEDYIEDVVTQTEEKIECNCEDYTYVEETYSTLKDEIILREIVELNIHNKIYKVLLGKDNIDLFNIKKENKSLLAINEIIYEYKFIYQIVDVFDSHDKTCFMFDKDLNKTIVVKK